MATRGGPCGQNSVGAPGPIDGSVQGRGRSVRAANAARTSSSSKRSHKSNRTGNGRQLLRDKKEEAFSLDPATIISQDILNHTEGDLLKMEKQFNLESKYFALTKGYEQYQDLEWQLATLHNKLISSRCHISRARKQPAIAAALCVTFVSEGFFPQFFSTERHFEGVPNFPSTFSHEMSIRRLILKIYASRYSTFATGKFIIKALTQFPTCPKGQVFNRIAILKYFFSHAKESASNFVNKCIFKCKEVISYVKDALASFFSGCALQLVALISVVIIILGVCSSGMFYVFRKVLNSICRETVPDFSDLPNLPTEDKQSVTDIMGQGSFDKAKQILSTIGETVTSTIDKAATFDPEAFINKFGRITSNLNSITSFLTKIWDFTKPMIEFVYMKITGQPLFDTTKMSIDIGKQLKIINELSQVYIKHKRFTPEEGNQMVAAADAVKTALSAKLHTVLPSLASSCTSTLLTHSGAIQHGYDTKFAARTRVKPVWLHLMGAAGVGKTWVSEHIIQWFRQMIEGVCNKPDDLYDRKVGNEYWEGYTKQFAVSIDDFLQSDDVETRRREVLELIYAVNSSPYHLHMAAVTEKTGHYFDSKFIITTSNHSPTQYLPDNLGIKDYNALYRRMTFKYVLFRKSYDEVPKIANEYKDSCARLEFKKLKTQSSYFPEVITLPEVLAQMAAAYYNHINEYATSNAATNEESLSIMLKTVRESFKTLNADDNYTAWNSIVHDSSKFPMTTSLLPQGEVKYPHSTDSDEDEIFYDDEEDYEASQQIIQNQFSGNLIAQGIFENIRRFIFDPQPESEILPEGQMHKRRFINEAEDDICLTSLSDYNGEYIFEEPIDENSAPTLDDDDGECEAITYPTDAPLPVPEKDIPTISRMIKMLKSTCTRADILHFMSNPTQFLSKCKYSPKDQLIDITVKDTVALSNQFNAKIHFTRRPLLSEMWKGILTSNETDHVHALLNQSITYDNFKKQLGSEATIDICLYIEDRLKGSHSKTRNEKFLDLYAAQFDIRARRKSVYGAISYDMYYTSDPDETIREVNSWVDQVYNQYYCSSIKAIKCSPETMMHISWEKSSIIGWKTLIVECTDFPSQYFMIESQRKDFKEITILDPYISAREKALVIVSVVGIISVAAALIGVAAKIISLYFSPDEKVLGQSFDKNTEKRSLKNLRKKPRSQKYSNNKKFNARKIKVITTDPQGQCSLPRGQSGLIKGQTGSIQHFGYRLAKSIEYVTYHTQEGECHGFVTFIRGHEFVTSSHLFKVSPVTGITIHWAMINKEADVYIPAKDFSIRFPPDGRDLAFVIIKSDYIPLYKDLTHQLNKREFFDSQTISSINRTTFSDSGEVVILQSADATPYKGSNGSESNISFNGKILPSKLLWIVKHMANDAGECGLAYFTNNTKYSKLLLGIHTAGRSGDSFFSPLFAEDFENMPPMAQGDWVEKQAIYTPAQVNDIEIKEKHKIDYLGLKTIGEIHYKGKLMPGFMPDKTNLRPTICQTKFHFKGEDVEAPFKTDKIPAKLRPYKEGDLIINPLNNALKRVSGRNAPELPPNLGRSKHFDGIFHSKFNYDKIYELTFEQALNGVKDSDFLGPLDLSSSSSIAFSEFGLTTRQVFPQLKRDLDFVITASPDFISLFNYRQEHYYKPNIVPPFFCIGTLKDETKLASKAHKPRIFANGAKVSLIEARMYCGSLFEQVISHKGEGDVFIGINPHSFDWNCLYRKMRTKSSTKIIADDIEAWDFNMRLSFIRYLEIEMKNRKIHENYIKNFITTIRSILTPYIVIKGIIYRYVGMPSGSYITAMINSMYNSWKNRVLWDYQHPSLNFDEFIAQACFGDDLLQAVSDELDESDWNGQILAALRHRFYGINTTPIAKNGTAVPKFVPLETVAWSDVVCQFLKRQFRVNDGLILPILDIESIQGMVSWVRPDIANGRTIDICTKENIETALRELVYHGKATYTFYYNYFEKVYQYKQWGSIPVSYEAELYKFLQS